MRNYLKRLRAHPGVPVAAVLTFAFLLAALSNKHNPGGAMWVALVFAALVWGVVLWTAGKIEHESLVLHRLQNAAPPIRSRPLPLVPRAHQCGEGPDHEASDLFVLRAQVHACPKAHTAFKAYLLHTLPPVLLHERRCPGYC
jgi:hypothetical protein